MSSKLISGEEPTDIADRAAADQTVPTVETVRIKSVEPGMRLGRYEILDELGTGGMAVVYRARDTELRREVAIKVLFPHLGKRPEVVTRFHREARAVAVLDHPNILRVHDVGGGRSVQASEPMEPPYIVMELVRGASLKEVFEEHWKAHREDAHGSPLGEVVAAIGAVVCGALGAAHRAGIVHRDVKPANILVAEGGRLVLADFGVARIEDDSLVTRSGMLLGTPAFMSPEQAAGRELDARSDIYSLGATLYWLATGTMPFTGNTAQVVWALTRGELTPPLRRNPAMGSELARCIERMMARDPAARPQDCQQAAAELAGIVAAAGLAAPAEELAAFFADARAYAAERTPRIAQATLERARQAARQRAVPRALALADRVLALEPEGPRNQEAVALVASLGDGQRRTRRLAMLAGCMALVGLAAAGGAWMRDRHGALVDGGMEADGGARALVGLEDAAGHDGGRAPEGSQSQAGAAALAASALVPDAAVAAGEQSATEQAGAASDEGTRLATGTRVKRPGQALVKSTMNGSSPDPAAQAAGGASSQATASTAGGSAGGATLPGASSPGASSPGASLDPASPVPPAQATITVDLRPWCDLEIDGKSYGRARRDQVIALSPGEHALVCTQGPGRAEWRRTIRLAPGQHLPLRGSVLQPVRIEVAVQGGDRISVDGRIYGNGQVLALSPGRYRVDVLSGAAVVAGGWISVPAVSACTVRDKPALDCYR